MRSTDRRGPTFIQMMLAVNLVKFSVMKLDDLVLSEMVLAIESDCRRNELGTGDQKSLNLNLNLRLFQLRLYSNNSVNGYLETTYRTSSDYEHEYRLWLSTD